MTAGDTVPVQAEKSILEVSTQETITISTSETLVVTSEMRELMVQLAPYSKERRMHHLVLTGVPLLPLWRLD